MAIDFAGSCAAPIAPTDAHVFYFFARECRRRGEARRGAKATNFHFCTMRVH
jgi:hypothetical protein